MILCILSEKLMETSQLLKNIRCWTLFLGWMVIVESSSNCPAEPKCEARLKGVKVFCTGGLHGKFLNGTRHRVQALTLCEWPNSTFDPEQIEKRFPGLKNLTVIESNITRLLEFDGDMKKLQVLELGNLNLELIENSAFSKLRKLRVLDLRNNQLSHIDPATLAGVPTLQEVYLAGNPWDCTSNLIWMVDETLNSTIDHQVVDQDKVICSNEPYRRRPVFPILRMLKTLEEECPKDPPLNCTCHMEYVAPDPDGVTLRPVTTINCSYRGLTELPEILPSVTTTLLVKGNQISNLKPLVNNPHYRRVQDVFLDNNQVHSIEDLEGADWLFTFRALSLRNNFLTQVPTYALDNALQRNRNAVVINLGNNPWTCDCLFTPTFQDFIIKYRQLVKDIDDVRCSSDSGDDNSLTQIQTLSRSSVCREPSEYLIRPLDLLNGILASLIVLVVGKLIYDYWSFKKTGKLPWIVAKMP